ncbi:MAG TPA: carbohydrate-binding family 9-like protein [Kofleriaceae bacterium]|jgi:hypothetical protein
MRLASIVALGVVLACAACVDRGNGPTGKKVDALYVKDHLLAARPAPGNDFVASGVILDGKVEYLGARISVPALAPGQTAKVTHYWRVITPPGADWKVFTLVRGAPGTPDFVNCDPGDMEIGHPVGDWKAGEIIEDPVDLAVRPDWKSQSARVLVGLVRIGGHGDGDRMAVPPGPKVVDRAIIAADVPVDLTKAPPPQGTVYVTHAPGPITIDGVGNDPGWAGAQLSPEFATAESSPEPSGKAQAKLAWDDQYLYVYVTIVDTDITTPFTKHDDTLWKNDDVEMFIDADGNRKGYVELQVNPANATFDSWFVGGRDKGDPSWDSGMITAVKVRGTVTAGDVDQGWDAEIAIPWEAVKGRDPDMKIHTPPEVGDRWHMNVVHVDVKSGGEKTPSASSWNRITYGDWHAVDRMLTIVFADSKGNVAPGSHDFGRYVPPDAAGSGSAAPAADGSGSAAGSGSGSGSAAEAPPPVQRAKLGPRLGPATPPAAP